MPRKFAIDAGVVIGPPPEFAATGAGSIGPDAYCDEILNGTVVVEGDTISAIGREIDVPNEFLRVDARDKICVPGFIALHVHGAAGYDFMAASPDGLKIVSGRAVNMEIDK